MNQYKPSPEEQRELEVLADHRLRAGQLWESTVSGTREMTPTQPEQLAEQAREQLTRERQRAEEHLHTQLNRTEATIPKGDPLEVQAREQLTQERQRAEERLDALLNRAEAPAHQLDVAGESLLFQKILVALDNSPSGRYIFERALRLAVMHHAHLRLLHILNLEDDGFASTLPYAPGDFYTFSNESTIEQYLVAREQARKLATKRMEALVLEAKEVGVAAEFVLQLGNPERAICRSATESGADLVIIGRRGHQGLSELFLGSVSNYVFHHAPCPVLVLQGESFKTTKNPTK